MNLGISDTRPEAAALQRSLLQQASPARKLAMVDQLRQTMMTLAATGLRQRYPQADPETLCRRLAGLLLGEGLATKAYGPRW